MVRKKSNTGARNPRNKDSVPVKKYYYTYEQVKEALKKNLGMKYATAHDLDISPSTMALYFKRWPRLEKWAKAGKRRQQQIAERKLWELIMREDKDGNEIEVERHVQLKAVTFWLQHKGGYNTVKIIRDERNKDNAVPIPTALSAEERLKILENVRQKQISITITEQSVGTSVQPLVEPLGQPILPIGGVVLENTPLLEQKKEETDFCI